MITDKQNLQVYDAKGALVPDAKVLNVPERTVACDGPECKNTITFTPKEAEETVAKNPWLNNVRIVKTPDERSLLYCSDDCEVRGITSGSHNVPTKKLIELVEGNDALKKAQQMGQTVQAVNEGIKKGPVLVK